MSPTVTTISRPRMVAVFLMLAALAADHVRAQHLRTGSPYIQETNSLVGINSSGLASWDFKLKQWDPSRGPLLYARLAVTLQMDLIFGTIFNPGPETLTVAGPVNSRLAGWVSPECPDGQVVHSESELLGRMDFIDGMAVNMLVPGAVLAPGSTGLVELFGGGAGGVFDFGSSHEGLAPIHCVTGTNSITGIVQSSLFFPQTVSGAASIDVSGNGLARAVIEFYPEPRILKTEHTPEGFAITWTNGPNGVVERRTSLGEGSWEAIGAPSSEYFLDTNAPTNGAFYRVVVPMPFL